MEQPSSQAFRLTPQTAFFRSLIEKSPDLVLVLDRLNRIRFASPSVYALVGYRPDEILYQPVDRFIDAQDRENFNLAVKSITRNGEAALDDSVDGGFNKESQLLLRWVCKDGSRRILDCILQNEFSDPLVGGLMFNGHEVTSFVETEKKLLDDRSKFLQYLEAVHSIVTVLDPNGKIIWANARACDFLGYPRSLLVGMNMFDHFLPGKIRSEVMDQFEDILNEIIQDGIASEFITTTSSGKERNVFWQISLLRDADQNVQGVVYAGEDITRLRHSENALKTSQERYMLALRGANDGIWDWNIMGDEFYCSYRWKQILGYAEDELESSPEIFWKFIHPDDREQFKAAVDSHLAGRTPKFELEHRMLHREGDEIWVLTRGLAICDEDGTAYRMAGSITDISARKVAEQRLVYDALHDSLTGLPNRLLFFDRLERAITRFKRNPGFPFAVLYLDIDNFKSINDAVGVHNADQLLVAFGQHISGGMRSVDTLARVGNDEFVILLEELLSLDDAAIVAERILDIERTPFQVNGVEANIRVSVGIVTASKEYNTPQEVVRDADIAMHHSKMLEQGGFEFFNPEMRQKALSQLELEKDLRDALRDNNLELHYQPIIELATMGVVGFEGLVRWHNPKRGLMYPAEFLPVAEEAGLIFNLDSWVLMEACQQIQKWRKSYLFTPPLTVRINLSTEFFKLENLPLQIEEVIVATGLEPGALIIEIVESTLLDNTGMVLQNLTKLHDMGVKLHVDDFGTGYSSLSYLNTLPLDMIKIDRSFVSRIGTGNTEVAHSIIRMAQEMKIETIAEGVENAVQFERLRSFGCRYGQGFFLGPPLPKDDVNQFLEKLIHQRHLL